METTNDILAHYVAKSKTPVFLREDNDWENLITGPPCSKVLAAFAFLSSCAMQYEGLNFGFTPPQSPREPAPIL